MEQNTNTIKNKKIKCVETGEIFNSAADAGRKYNSKQVANAANPNNSHKTAAGYHWRYYEENN